MFLVDNAQSALRLTGTRRKSPKMHSCGASSIRVEGRGWSLNSKKSLKTAWMNTERCSFSTDGVRGLDGGNGLRLVAGHLGLGLGAESGTGGWLLCAGSRVRVRTH